MGGFTRNEKRLIAGLWALPGFGPVGVGEVLARLDADAILDLPFAEWLPSAPVPTQSGNLLEAAGELGIRNAAESADRMRELCRRTRTRVTFLGEPDYPQLLATIDQAPQILFFKGPGGGVPHRPRLAMVGSRIVEPNIFLQAQQLAQRLSRAGLGIVSGAAEGIDTACHRGALEAGGETWAFLGSSIDEVDAAPRENTERILAAGGSVFSEFPPTVRACRGQFPRRNWLISGAADATLVVRAKANSGAKYTADAALEQGRPLFSMPGDLDSPTSALSNRLIASGKARICLDGREVLEALGLHGDALVSTPRRITQLPDDIGDEAKRIWEMLAGTPMDFDTLMVATGLPSGAVSAGLTALELIDAVLERPGRVYYRAQ